MQPAPIQISPRPERDEAPWTDYVDTVLRRRRFVAIGTVGAWAVIGLAALLVPRDYQCSAALALPPVMQPTETDRRREERDSSRELALKKEEAPKPGIPVALYKRVERVISDESVLDKGMAQTLSAGEVRDLVRSLDEHFSPITSSARDDLQRMDREDTIIGIELSYTTHPADRARQVVNALGALAHDAFVTSYAMDQVLSQTVKASFDGLRAGKERMELAQENTSLEKQAADMARVLSEARHVAVGSAREIVDTREGGHLFLPPGLQLVGIHAKQVENAYKSRLLEHDTEMAELRLEFLRRLDGRLAEGVRANGSPALKEIPRLIQEELDAFLSGPGADRPGGPYLKIEVAGMSEAIASVSSSTRFVQTPTLKRKPRALALSVAAAAAAVFFIAAALVAESWRQYHQRG